MLASLKNSTVVLLFSVLGTFHSRTTPNKIQVVIIRERTVVSILSFSTSIPVLGISGQSAMSGQCQMINGCKVKTRLMFASGFEYLKLLKVLCEAPPFGRGRDKTVLQNSPVWD